jgi:hypothetical protein
MATVLHRLALGIAAALVVSGCVSVTAEPRALLIRDDGSIHVQTLACPSAVARAANPPAVPAPAGLDPGAIRLATWNVHKQADPGWQRDLRTLENERRQLLRDGVEPAERPAVVVLVVALDELERKPVQQPGTAVDLLQ